MKQVFLILALFVLGLTTRNSFGQSTLFTKTDTIVVYGNDFAFKVNAKIGWIGDIDLAKQYYSNIIFFKSKDELKNGGAIIQINVFKKQDEKTEKDLEYDIKSYIDKYKDLKKQELIVSNKEYKCFSMHIYVDKVFYMYTAYINPGVNFKKGFSVSMNVSKRNATEEELTAFREIIASLVMLKI